MIEVTINDFRIDDKATMKAAIEHAKNYRQSKSLSIIGADISPTEATILFDNHDVFRAKIIDRRKR